MIPTVLLVILVLLLIVYRLYQWKKIILQLTWWERIYSAVLYVGLFAAMIYGYSIIKKWLSGIFQYEIMEVLILLSYTGITAWIIVTILGRFLSKKILHSSDKK